MCNEFVRKPVIVIIMLGIYFALSQAFFYLNLVNEVIPDKNKQAFTTWPTGRPPHVFMVNKCWHKMMLKSMARIEETWRNITSASI